MKKESTSTLVKDNIGMIQRIFTAFGFTAMILLIAAGSMACGDESDDDPSTRSGPAVDEDSPEGLASDITADRIFDREDKGEDMDEWSSKDYRQQTTFAPLTPNGQTVSFVDVDRYLGKWYEIATFEMAFQRNCTGTTATYGLNENGTISVTNECYKGSLDGRYDVARAYAKVVDEETNAKLKVFFFPLFGAPYWIIELDGAEGDQPYQFAVVGSSTNRYLWILSRTPQMDEDRLNKILDRLVERGYDIDKLSFTLHSEN